MLDAVLIEEHTDNGGLIRFERDFTNPINGALQRSEIVGGHYRFDRLESVLVGHPAGAIRRARPAHNTLSSMETE